MAVDGSQVQGQVSQVIHPLLLGLANQRGRQAQLRPLGLLLCPLCFFLYSLFSDSLFFSFICLISLLLFPCANIWENAGARVRFSYSHTECRNLLSRGHLRCGQAVHAVEFNYTRYFLFLFFRASIIHFVVKIYSSRIQQ